MSPLSARFSPSLKQFTQHITWAAGACFLSGQAIGAGFALNETSAAAAGNAYAGRAAAAQDSSALASNPAALSSLNREQWTAGGALVLPKGELSNYSATAGKNKINGTSGEKFVGPVFVPGLYYLQPFDDKLSFGVGVYVPFGLHTDYNDRFMGRYLADRSEVTNFNIQPTVSYRLTDELSVGVGVFAAYVDGLLSQKVYIERADFKSTVKGDDWGAGLKVGGLWDNGTSSLGVSWTSNAKFTLEGSVKLEGPGLHSKADGHLKFKLPQMFEIGGSHKLNQDWTFVAGALWTGWSSFKEIRVIVDKPFQVPLSANLSSVRTISKGKTITYVPEKWKDVWSFSLGARYQLDPQWLLRFGYGHDKSPVDDKYRTARIPDADRNWLTLGARFTPSNSWIVDMAYGYLIPKTVKVDEKSHGGLTPLTYKGKYKMSAQIAMVSMTYQY